MKLSLNWLKDYIDPKLSTNDLVERLTMAGLEIEAVEAVAGDTVLEIEVTPNRPDCLSVLGLAREIGAITGRKVTWPKIKNVKTAIRKDLVRIENKKDCSRYIGTLIADAHIKDAPKEIQQRLLSVGIATINNAVDITNFVLMEMGQPLHAFDYDKLEGGQIIVRRAKPHESLITLDGVERKLDGSILVIADAKKPVAIAGIMGGRDTQITSATKNIFLESACFDMGLVRRASHSLGLRSDSSYRFERHVDDKGVLAGANRATDLLQQATAGRLSAQAEVALRGKQVTKRVKVKIADIESLLGVKVTGPKIKKWLEKLGFKVTVQSGALTVTVPSQRIDIEQDVDIIEEIARMIGFDRLPSSLPVIKMTNLGADHKPRLLKDNIRRALTAAGCDEIITHSMISRKALEQCQGLPEVRVFNPLTQEQELMRPSMMPSLLQAVVTNISRGQKDLRFFEIGKCYFKDGEKEILSLGVTGRRWTDWRLPKKEMVDFFDLKAMTQGVLQCLNRRPVYTQAADGAFDIGCFAHMMFESKTLGHLGKINRNVLSNWDIKHQDVYFAQINLDAVLAIPQAPLKYKPFSEFPAIVRDVSLAVKTEMPYKEIEEVCLRQGTNILKSVQLIEQYLGDKIQPGTKGLVFSCQYQSDTRTLREDEVSEVHERIVQSLVNDLGAIRR